MLISHSRWRRSEKMNANEILCKLLLLFPIFTLFQSFSFLGWINKALLIFVIVILLFLITRKIEKRWVGILFAVFVVHVYALMQTTFPLYNSNMLFYYGFWILLVVYYTSCSKRAMETFKKSERFTRGVVQIWSVIVGISIFMPSSYVINKAWGSGRYFVSITGDAFRLAPTCLMIVTLVLGLYCLTRKKKYLLYITIPMYGFLMCGSRTYLGVGLLVILAFWYIYCPQKKYFYFSLIPLAAIMGTLVLNSAAGSKIAATTYTTTSIFDKWGTITNGRTVFWSLDLKYFFKENIFNQLLGCGFNFDYQITKRFYTSAHWAHNDFISILLNFGYVGLGIYFYSVYKLLKVFVFEQKMPKLIVLLVFMIWFLNAMFNMFYTYTCSMVCFPMMLIALREYYVLKVKMINEQD